MSVSLFVASLDSAGLSFMTYEILLFSAVNFETFGLVLGNTLAVSPGREML